MPEGVPLYAAKPGAGAGNFMSPDAGQPSAGAFPTTNWSQVARAGDVDPAVKRDALGRLLSAYIPAFRAHLIRRRHVPADQADDLLQGFICDQVVAEDLIARADRQRGRFRTFVLVALDRYLVSVRRSENALKRKPQQPILQIEHGDGACDDGTPAAAPAADAETSSVDVFDLAWAREVVERAVRQMRDCCADGTRERVWLVFDACVLAPFFHDAAVPSHATLMQQLGLESPQQVSNLLVTAKRTFARVLRLIVAEYVGDGSEIEAELRDLWSVLSRAGHSSASLTATGENH